jgi:hypothetical protein
VARNLNSADCFVLVTPTNSYSWKGRGATADEHTVATNIASILAGSYLGISLLLLCTIYISLDSLTMMYIIDISLCVCVCVGKGGRVLVQIEEGSEPEAFWAALGGQGEYATFREGGRPFP